MKSNSNFHYRDRETWIHIVERRIPLSSRSTHCLLIYKSLWLVFLIFVIGIVYIFVTLCDEGSAQIISELSWLSNSIRYLHSNSSQLYLSTFSYSPCLSDTLSNSKYNQTFHAVSSNFVFVSDESECWRNE